MDRNNFSANLVAARGNRCSASLLSWLEDHVYEHLPDDLQSDLRTEVLDHVNDLKNLAIDIVKSDMSYMNEYYVEGLAQIHNELSRIRNGDNSN